MDAGLDTGLEAEPGWSYTVPVRTLCEFTARQGDLDRRFTPSATAQEGQQGQQWVTSRRGPGYETELALQGRFGGLRVRGRADGFDAPRGCLEEIKAIRGTPEAVAANRRALHWAQVQTYGALLCRQRGITRLTLALVYVDMASQTETVLRQDFTAAALQALFEARCAAFLAWAQQEAGHRSARDAALAALPFPPGDFRPGQRALAESVYRSAAAGRFLLAQAPTGIGKTIGTLFPLLRAVPGQGIDKLAYLTNKGTAGTTALQALQGLRGHTAGQALRVLAMVSKDNACEHPGQACHPDSCALARGFYDRLGAARAQAVAEGWLDAAAQRRIALQHGICPYHLGQELLRWADVLVGDVHHLFDHHGALWSLLQALGWKLALLVDEAHNLADRARAMYSAALPLATLQAAAGSAAPALQAPLQVLAQAAAAVLAQALGGAAAPAAPAAPAAGQPAQAVLDEPPEALLQALREAGSALAEHLQQQPLLTGPVLDLQFLLQRFARLADTLGPHTLLVAQGAAPAAPGEAETPASARLLLHNLVPAGFLRPRWLALASATLFSATLAPPGHQARLLGLPGLAGEGGAAEPRCTAWIELPPAFDPAHLVVRVADGISTRFAHRGRSMRALVALLAQQFDAHPGNYLAFFSSFDYLGQVADLLAVLRPDIPQARQDRRMGAAARAQFLARFAPGGQCIGFAVLGGVFGEGVDLPGSRLVGAFIATLGLPPPSPLQAASRARLEALLGSDDGDAALIAAMHKVVQAAGRVQRTPEDRGWLWLLDDRYRRAEVRALLPAWWQIS